MHESMCVVIDMRLTLILLLALALIATGCSTVPTEPSPNIAPQQAVQRSSGHLSWGQWAITLDPEAGTARATPVRDANVHLNVTSWLHPPACADCLQIILTGWDPVARIVDVTLVLKNPTQLTGYDVKAIISGYDTKEFLSPDAYADFYTDGTTWDPYYIFAENEDLHAFEGLKSHAVGIKVHFPVGATPNAFVTVDVSWPDPQPEPWRIGNIIVAGPLQNDSVHHISFSCHIWDNYDDVQVVFCDLSPIGPANVAMGDDAGHKDYLAGDGIWGLDEIKTGTLPGTYDVWVRARSGGSDRYTYQKLTLEVILPVSNPPPLYIVSMMHAEEDPSYMDEQTYLGYSETLRELKKVFEDHGAKIALQPDWTFIQGTVVHDPTLFSDFQASGHGVDTHAHETQYDLGQVHDMLDQAGVVDTIIANGGFDKTWGDGNWVAYITHFQTPGGQQMFQAVNAYKDPLSQVVDSLATPIRPSTSGDWMVNDPNGLLVYIPGAPNSYLVGSNPSFFQLLPQAVDYALEGVIPGRVNCFYWHDPVGLYNGSLLSKTRLDFWDQVLNNYFDQKVAQGDVVWANFTEMYQAYLDWEEDN